MRPDLHATRIALLAGPSDARTEMEHAIAAAESPACDHVFTAHAVRRGAPAKRAAAAAEQPLAGLAVSVKDLFDIAGQPTPAGSVVLAACACGARPTPSPSPACAPPAARWWAAPT